MSEPDLALGSSHDPQIEVKTDLEAIRHARTVKVRQGRLETVPKLFRGLFVKAWAKKGGKRTAIWAQCLECQGFDRDAIAGCSSPACSLYEYRPYQKKP